jgi:hypothetical protein
MLAYQLWADQLDLLFTIKWNFPTLVFMLRSSGPLRHSEFQCGRSRRLSGTLRKSPLQSLLRTVGLWTNKEEVLN